MTSLPPNKNLLPVTLLSGFLGAGKTSLLKHMLQNQQGKKYAVIVNDMAELNIDAELIQNSSLLQTQEKVVQLQNGCICCTLRGDLLLEVARLAKTGKFDYLVIESTGISEPMQVAETFTFSVDEFLTPETLNQNSTKKSSNPDHKPHSSSETSNKKSKQKGKDIPAEEQAELLESLKCLKDLARLDTCVTVIDACSFDDTFQNAESVRDIYKDADEKDARNLSDLMVDQIEFANVIVINKTDLVNSKVVGKIKALVKSMNPTAEIILTQYGKVDLNKITDTGLFCFEKAALSPGWLKSIEGELIPETEEYGVSSFVYRARRPFHPQRLWDLLEREFVLQEENYTDGNRSGDTPDNSNQNDEEEDDQMEEINWVGEEEDELDSFTVSVNKVKEFRKENGGTNKLPFEGVLRSKGFFWMGSRYDLMGEWSQSGLVLMMSCGGVFFSCMPEEDWPIPDDESARKKIRDRYFPEDEELKLIRQLKRGERKNKVARRRKVEEEEEEEEEIAIVGDRRQEIVFIGIDLKKDAITKALNKCLVSNEEWMWYLKLVVEDPWLPWPHALEFMPKVPFIQSLQ